VVSRGRLLDGRWNSGSGTHPLPGCRDGMFSPIDCTVRETRLRARPLTAAYKARKAQRLQAGVGGIHRTDRDRGTA